ncbi:MAG: D-alanine--D-alanine ligase [Gemmatimonadota bacterium]|nr:D-alanine--D-alanine ligase [Gemmatimonadota bacterium]
MSFRRVSMTLIGLAYNQKPEPTELAGPVSEGGRQEDGELPRPDEEPPSKILELSVAELIARDEFAEWDSPTTIAAVESALSRLGKVVRLEATEDFPERLRQARPDIVFNIAEGFHGVNREAHVPAICEFFGIPYSGSDPFTLSLCLDKARTKETLTFHGIPTPSFAVVERPADLEKVGKLALPLFVKPLHEGSSKGITDGNLCWDRPQLLRQTKFLLENYNQPVIVEEYLPGKEFTCAVLGNGREARVLPIVGMNFEALPKGALPIYSFDAKFVWDRPEKPLEIFQCPARITRELQASIERVTLDAFRVLGCRDWARIDVRLDAAGVPNVLEVNPLPGILPDPADNSCLPKAARAAGIGYEELIQSCLRYAAARQGVDLESSLPQIGAARSEPLLAAS